MNKKKISKVIASALAANMVVNPIADNIRIVSAVEVSDLSTDNSEALDESSLEDVSGVYVEQMQSDFESVANDDTIEDSTEKDSYGEEYEEVPDGTIVGDANSMLSILSYESNTNAKTCSMATFSFDGDNAGKIIITDTNIQEGVEFRYSLDGGNNWIITSEREIQLTNEQIASITATNDIKIGLAKLDTYEVIDIKDGVAPTVNDVYKNDWENRFFGKLENLQISTDNGANWKDYDPSESVGRNKIVTQVRYKAHGVYLTSPSAQFTFQADTDTDRCKYIEVSHVSFVEACSEEIKQANNAAVNLIDGNGNTIWHNNWAGTDSELFYTVMFDEIKFINKIEYVPTNGVNGKLKSGQILVSHDGKVWEVAGTFEGLNNNNNTKTIQLDFPTAAKYLKIKATETWGNKANTFISGSMLNFYEDSTMEYSDEASVVYSNTEKTTNSITATLVLPVGYTTDEKTHKFVKNGTHVFTYRDTQGVQHTIEAKVENIVDVSSEKGVYLSDLDTTTGTNIGYSTLKKDTNIDGGTISLIVNGSAMSFKKGIGIHAPSTVVYDIEGYSNEYSRFTGYFGVDSGKGSNGSVKFVVSASKDGKTWTELKKIDDVLTGNTESVYVDVNVKGYSYLKIYADQSINNNAMDHSVVGDARLIKENYSTSSEYYTGFKTLAQYDNEISSRTVEDNFANYKKQVLEREFVNRYGYNNIISTSKDSEGVYEALTWLQNDSDALRLLIEAGNLFSGNGYNALVALGKLYKEFKGDLVNITYKKMMLATVAAYSKNLKSFMVDYGGNCVGANPVEAYRNFKKLYDDGRFVRQSEFENYSMELVRAVVDARTNYDEILWLRDYIDKKYPPETHLNNWVRYNGYGYAKYVNTGYGKAEFYDETKKADWDKKYGFLNYGVSYGNTNLYRMWMFMEAGAICWGLSGLGMVVNEVQGIPAIGTYQPGHEAYLLYSVNKDGKGIWSISDDIAGWGKSFSRWGGTIQTEHRLLLGWGQMEYNTLNNSGYANNTSYMLLAQDALNDYNNYLESMYYNLIANSYAKGSAQHEEALNKSLGCYSKNLDSMYGLYKSYSADSTTTNEEWIKLAEKVATEYRYFPAPMVDLLNLIKEKVTDETLKISIDMMMNESLTKASVATSKESLQDKACRQVANDLLGKTSSALATFSFDGDNANKIIINDRYSGSTIQVRVSLDGGTTWEKFENDATFTTSHIIELTDEQVKRITAEKDILVGLMGTEANYTIDIKDGVALGSDIYLNDDENILIGGNLANVEYSTDNGVTWENYDNSGLKSTTRFEGDVTVLFRYKANGVYLQGPSKSYKFTKNEDTETSKYVQLQNVSIHTFSSQQSTTDKAAKNIIDGNFNTRWHTTWDWLDNKKYISFEFDQVRFINKIGYMPYSDDSGEMKSGNVYISMDGENWTKVHEYKDLPNVSGNTWKYIELDKAYMAKYIKIDSTESYYKSLDQKDVYFAGRMMSFFEDTTQTYDATSDVEITYERLEDSVIAKVKLPEGCTIIGESEFEFKGNGTHEFRFLDANGVEQRVEAEVTDLKEELPSMTYEFDYKTITNKDVTMTITSFSKDDVKLVQVIEDLVNESSEEGDSSVEGDSNTTYVIDESVAKDEEVSGLANTYTFTENKTVTFVLEDSKGIRSYNPITVNWIDKEAPTAEVIFDISTWTNKNVKATLVNPSENITITNLPEGQDYYIFEKNDVFTFEFVDEAGNIGTAIAKVTWIDKEAPDFTIEYSTTDPTNESVIATVTGLEEGEKVVSEGGATHTFETNGTFTFIVRDLAGNETKKEAKVTWIDKTAPTIDVEYSTKELTNKDVVVKLVGLKDGDVVVNNDGKTEYTFEENGKFEFIVKNKLGTEVKVLAEVTWIDKEAPDFTIEYSTTELTNQSVTATVKGLGEGEKVVSEGGETHTFETNGTFTFIVRDLAGNETKKEAKVTWIDKTAPTIDVEYSTKELTNKDVVVKLVGLKDGDVVVNNDGKTEYTFEENGKFEFIVKNKLGTEVKVLAEVTWIDKEAPDFTIEYSTTELTNQSVTATVKGLGEGEKVVSEGGETHTFEKNGTFEFVVRDLAGNETRKEAKVTWIDKEPPTAVVAFDYSKASEGKVIAKLVDMSDDFDKILGDGKDTYEFTSNGSYTFRFIDKAGNIGTAIANIDWFKFEEADTIVDYKNFADDKEVGSDDSTEDSDGSVGDSTEEDKQVDYVIASISIDKEKMKIVNNNGSDEVKFIKNGEFRFRVRMLDTEEEFEILVKVDWLAETAEEGESPVEIPETDDSDEGNSGNGDNGTSDGEGSGNGDNGTSGEGNSGNGNGGTSGGEGSGNGDNGTSDEGNSGNGDNGTSDEGNSGNGDNGTSDGGNSGNGDNGTSDGGNSGNGDNGTSDGENSGNGDNGTSDGGNSGNGDNGTSGEGNSGNGDNTANIPGFIEDAIASDIVSKGEGNGSVESPLELEVNDVTLKVFETFLTNLKKVNSFIVAKYNEGNFTIYKIKVEYSSILSRIISLFKESTHNYEYIYLKVANDLEFANDIINAIDENIKIEDSNEGTTEPDGDDGSQGENGGITTPGGDDENQAGNEEIIEEDNSQVPPVVDDKPITHPVKPDNGGNNGNTNNGFGNGSNVTSGEESIVVGNGGTSNEGVINTENNNNESSSSNEEKKDNNTSSSDKDEKKDNNKSEEISEEEKNNSENKDSEEIESNSLTSNKDNGWSKVATTVGTGLAVAFAATVLWFKKGYIALKLKGSIKKK